VGRLLPTAQTPRQDGEELKIIYISVYMMTRSSAARRPSSGSFRYPPGWRPAAMLSVDADDTPQRFVLGRRA